MDLIATTGASLLLVNLVFASIALAIGFAAGAWVCGGREPPKPGCAEDKKEDLQAAQRELDIERTVLASDRLRDLATNVATEVGAHSASIEAIEAKLSDNEGGATAEMVLQALADIEQANHSLKDKLAQAEEQIKDQAEQIRTHESEARTDSLTSLANRRAFDDEIARRLSEWERYGTPFSLLILDVDHFKKFNDTHGHQAGDEVLRAVGRAISDCARDMDLACRYGGEEFAVIMPATEAVDGSTLAERVRLAIESMEAPFEGKTLSVTSSLGIADIRTGDTTQALIRRADEALYASKGAGRNNAHRHNGSECVPITPGKSAPVEEAETDEAPTALMLDGLPNRTRFLDLLRNEIRLAQDAGAPLTLFTAEFESYHQIEAEFGESVARLTLDSIAQFLDSAIQEDDRLGRLGNGQFIVMMPRQTVAQAEKAGERINAALVDCSVPLGDSHINLTTHIQAIAMNDEDSAVTLMQRVEDLLKLTPMATS